MYHRRIGLAYRHPVIVVVLARRQDGVGCGTLSRGYHTVEKARTINYAHTATELLTYSFPTVVWGNKSVLTVFFITSMVLTGSSG